MKNILILGANGQIAKLVRDRLLKETDDNLTLNGSFAISY